MQSVNQAYIYRIVCLLAVVFLGGGIVDIHAQVTPIAHVVESKGIDFEPIHLGERFTIDGTVTAIRQYQLPSGPSYRIFLQDETAGIRVYGVGMPPDIKEGQFIEVQGTLELNLGRVQLVEPVYKPLTLGANVLPLRVEAYNLTSAAYNARLVEVSGRILSLKNNPNYPAEQVLSIEDNTGIINIWLVRSDWSPQDLARLETGAIISATGLIMQSLNSGEINPVFFLRLRRSSDITVIKPAPFFTSRQKVAVVCLVLLLTVPLAWGYLLRRTVQQKTSELVKINSELQREAAERRQGEQALRDSEERYRLLFESNPQPMWVYDSETLAFLAVSESAIRHYGYSREEFLSMTLPDIRPDDGLPDLIKALKTLPSGLGSSGIHRHKKRDGSIINVEICSHRIQFNQRKAGLALATDITERTRVEEALRQSEQRYRHLVELSPDGVAIFCDGRVAFINNRGASLLGATSSDQIVGRSALDFIPPDQRSRVARRLEMIAGQDREFPLAEERLIALDGNIIESEVDAIPFTFEGRPAVQVVFRDISQRKQAEDNLRASEAKHRALLEAIPDLLFQISPEGAFVDFKAPRNFPSLQPFDRSIGKPDAQSLPAHIAPLAAEYAEHAMRTGQTQVFEYQVEGDGQIIYHEARVALNGAGGLLVMVRDITERKLLEEQLRQAQKMEAVGKLAGGVAHDFNNMLTAILGYSELLLGHIKGDEFVRTGLVEIKHAAERSSALTGQLLAFSRKQLLKPKIFNLNDLISNMTKMLRLVIGEDIDLITDLAKDLSQVKADPGQLEQVILNLVVNARDAMPHGGRLLVKTTGAHAVPQKISVARSVAADSYITLSISDTGTGIDAVTLNRIFEPFFTTKGQGKGTGLGLATVYGIIKQSGGFIEVDSEPGNGTTFEVYLPVPKQPEQSTAEDRNSASVPKGVESILVVEDEEVVRNMTCQVLNHSGYRVLAASSAAEALTVCQQDLKIDLLLTDVVMPQMSGRELAERLLELRPELKVVYMSGYTDDAVIRHGISEKLDFFLQKPFTPAVLAQRIRNVLDLPAMSAGREVRV